ncbi:MAG: hypothetical protein KDJ25_01815 [Rhodoblastus sp.]|nr:hypothetical protein [Rhodoblastus sp.]
MTGTAATDRDAEARAHILTALERSVAIGLAESSDRQRQLMRFLVTEEIEGRGDRLKAYAIATQVFGRPADFDAQQDAIVRVEVGRLRKSLELYFATSGAADEIRIVIDKGGYRPRFEFHDQSAAGSAPAPAAPGAGSKIRWLALAALAIAAICLGVWGWRQFFSSARSGPRIAVAPFTLSADRDGQGYVGVGLRAEVVSVLSEFEWLTVFPLTRQADLSTLGRKKNAKIDYFLKASVQLAGEALVVTPLLLDAETGVLRWSKRYETSLKASEMLAMERDIAVRVAADVGQPFGVVANIELTRIDADAFNGDEAYRCHLRAIQFWSTYRRDDFAPARQCADRLAAGGDANVQAMRAILLLDAARLDYDARPRAEILTEAATLAGEAYRRSDKAALPRVARYSTALCQGEIEIFKRVGLAAVRDYPNNPATLLDVGAKMALGAGDWQHGVELVARARALSGYSSNWFEFADVVDAIRRNADADVEGLHAAALDSAHPLLLVVDAALQSRLHNEDARRAAMATLAAAGYDGPQAVTALIERQCWTREAKSALAGRLTADAGGRSRAEH